MHPHSSVSKKLLSEEHNVSEGNDIISNLPETVLLHILSFLSTKDAIRTSILSRKWEYLWTSISIIELDGSYPLAGKKENRCFLDFVERVLLLHDASDIKSLILVLSKRVNSSRLSSWICALVRHNVEELDLSLHWKTQPILPCCLFTCQSLVVLKLPMYWSLKVPSLTHFSKLKTLELWNVTFPDDNSTQHLFSSCPVLQELDLVNYGWKNLKTITICIPTLKKLKIENERMRSEDVLSCVTKIYATNLIHLDCFNCLIVDFRLHDLSSLVDASICLYDDMLEQDLGPRVLRLLTGIFNVTKLSTTSEMVEVGKLSTCDSFEAPQDEASIVENDATLEDMEGAAVAYVADILKVPAIFIKALTNIVDGDKPSIVEYRQNLAVVTAAIGLAVTEVVDFSMGSASPNNKS